MYSFSTFFIFLVLVMLAIGVAWWVYTTYVGVSSSFSLVYPTAAYVDERGNFLICVYNAGPGQFSGRWVISLKSGKVVEISLVVGPGEHKGVRGSLNEPFSPGMTVPLVITTGGGGSYTLYPIIVSDINSVKC